MTNDSSRNIVPLICAISYNTVFDNIAPYVIEIGTIE